MCNDCITRDEVKTLMASYGVPTGAQMFVGADELQYFDSTGKGLSNSQWRCWAIQNGGNGTEDARGKFFAGYSLGDADFGTADGTGGTKTFVLDIDNIPDHTHLTVSSLTSVSQDDSTLGGDTGPYIQVTDNKSTALNYLSASITGGVIGTTDVAKQHLPPYLVRIPVEKICTDYTL